jgi:NAD(P)H-dependent FMN reductase
MKIVIITASVRKGRKSDRVSLYFKNHLASVNIWDAEIVDLAEYNFPVFEERLKYLKEPDEKTLAFAEKIRHADGVLIVTPEYNGGYPASLKNVIDLLIEEWKHKPVAISTVSSGAFGGSQVITSLLFTLWKIGAYMVPAMFPVPHVEDNFSEDGTPKDKPSTDKRAAKFVNELIQLIKLKQLSKA